MKGIQIIAAISLIGCGVAWAGAPAAEQPSKPVFTLPECLELGLKQAAAARNSLRDEQIAGERLLVAAGRSIELSGLNLEKAGVATTPQGAIQVDKYLRTSQKHIFALTVLMYMHLHFYSCRQSHFCLIPSDS